MRHRLLWIAAAVLVASPLMLRLLIRAVSPRPGNLGVTDGQLAECPQSPNCVSTRVGDAEHTMTPWPISGDAPAVLERLRTIVSAQPGAKLVAERDNYLYFEFTSRWMGFVDDVEFLLDPQAGVIQFRSASRLGYSDLGVNRRRMETIRQAFDAQTPGI